MKAHNSTKALVAAAAAALIASTAISAEGPQEGDFTVKTVTSGKEMAHIAAGNPMGKDGMASVARVAPFQEVGAVSYQGALSLAGELRCIGMQQEVKGLAIAQAYCVDTDADGDQILWKVTAKPRPVNDPNMRLASEMLFGTGKYARMMATAAFTCQLAPSAGGFARTCEGPGTYQRP